MKRLPRWTWLFALLWVWSCAATAALAPRAPELELGELGPDGYREFDFRAPTPATTAHGWTLETHEVVELLEHGEVIPIDVQPIIARPATPELASGWLPNKPRLDLPGSVWLPNVGYPELSARMDAYFRANLERITEGNLAQPLLFYCIADCWFSWNAVKRAASYGYTRLYWYPLGTDGWREAELPFQEAIPVPLEGSENPIRHHQNRQNQ